MAEHSPQKVKVYVDGENLVHELLRILKHEGLIKHRSDLVKFDLRYLLQELVTDKQHARDILYYTTKLRQVNEPDYLAKLTFRIAAWNSRWTPWLIGQGVTVIKAGMLKKRDGHRCRSCGETDQLLQEKGVDVRMATDIVYDVLSKTTTLLYIVSSDSDLIPAITKAKRSGVKIIYMAPSEKINRAIVAVTDEVKVFDQKLVIEAFKRVNNG